MIEAAKHMGVGIGRRTLEGKVRQEGLALSERGLGRTGVRLTTKGRSVSRPVRSRT
jgi:hypothetical protein